MKLQSLSVLWEAESGPSEKSEKLEDRLLLFSMIFGLKPSRCLEIGTFRGGSAQVIVEALNQCGSGKLVAIDPEPQIADHVWQRIKHRCQLVAEPSPAAIPKASSLVAGGQFDFVFIDGDHARAFDDLRGVMPYLAPGAYIVCHDCYFKLVQQDIQKALRKYPSLIDCGMLGTHRVQIDGHWWTGSQVLRFCPSKSSWLRGWTSLKRLHLRNSRTNSMQEASR